VNLSRPLQRGNDKETRRRMQSMELLEERIREQENAIQRLSSELQRAGDKQAYESVAKLGWQIAHAQAALDELLVEWEKVAA
jgi:hypothetical protein